jgi:hypothetical protein
MIDNQLDLLLLIEKAKKAAQKMGDVEIAYQLYRVELNVRCGTPDQSCWACLQDLPEEKQEPEENPEEWYPSPGDFAGSPPVYPGFDL